MTGRIRRIAAVGLAIIGVSLLVSAGRAEADTSSAGSAGSTPILDVSTYPTALPAGCPDGAGALSGVRYENGRGGVEAEFSRLSLGAGDTVTLRWDGFAPGCLDGAGQPAISVTLAAYLTPTTQFDPTVDQKLADWTSCGLGAAPCAKDADGYSLRLAVPPDTVGCRFQIDAILGNPLAVVGPGGSFYGSALRGGGPSMLIGAATVDIPNCVPGVAPTTTTSPPPVAPPPVAPPPSGPTTTVTATAPPSPPSTVATTSTSTTAAAAVQGIAVTRQTLPATGSATARTTGVGTGMVFAGLAALVLSALLSSRRRPLVPLVASAGNRPNDN